MKSLMGELGGTLRFATLLLLFRNKSMNPSEIAKYTDVSRSQISRLLAELEQEDLIEKSKSEGKYVEVSLSYRGFTLLEKLVEFLSIN